MPKVHLVSSLEEPKLRGIIFIGHRCENFPRLLTMVAYHNAGGTNSPSRDKQNGELDGHMCHRQIDIPRYSIHLFSFPCKPTICY
jgi:hypothetical protein